MDQFNAYFEYSEKKENKKKIKKEMTIRRLNK